MLKKLKKTITSCTTDIKNNPRKTFLTSSYLIGCLLGEIIALETEPRLLGFYAIGGAAIGAAFAGITIYCCCPPPSPLETSSIRSTTVKNENDTASKASIDVPSPTTSPTHRLMPVALPETVISINSSADPKTRPFTNIN